MEIPSGRLFGFANGVQEVAFQPFGFDEIAADFVEEGHGRGKISTTFGTIQQSSMNEIPVFHRRIFWDVDFDTLGYEKEYKFIITRVFDRGDVPDIRNCRWYYGDEKITDVLLNTKFLSEVRTYLAAAVIGRPLTDF